MDDEEFVDTMTALQGWNWRSNKTTKTRKKTKVTKHADGDGNYLVMGVDTERTFCNDLGGIIDHAASLIHKGNSDEFLILKVVGRVKKKRPPVEYEAIK